MKFKHVHCFDEVKIINSQPNVNVYRMSNTKVKVKNSVNGTTRLCGTVKGITDDFTLKGRTYRYYYINLSLNF
jgi:hypothetical protein